MESKDFSMPDKHPSLIIAATSRSAAKWVASIVLRPVLQVNSAGTSNKWLHAVAFANHSSQLALAIHTRLHGKAYMLHVGVDVCKPW